MAVQHSPAVTWWNNARGNLLGGRASAGSEVQGDDEIDNAVVRYYLHTWKDFRGAWMDSHNRAMHFGYWDCSVNTHGESLIRANEILASLAQPDRSARCLDLGCGVGGTAMWLAGTYGCTVTGVSVVADQVDRLHRYASERSLASLVSGEVADFHSLPFDDDSFDVVYAQEAICHSPDPLKVLGEAMRVLRSGGRLVLAEYILAGDGDSVSGALRVLQRSWAMPKLLEHGGLQDWADDNCEPWQLRDVTTHMIPSLRRLNSLARVTVRGQRVLRRFGLRSDVQIDNVEGSLALNQSLVNGDWYYGMFRGVAK